MALVDHRLDKQVPAVWVDEIVWRSVQPKYVKNFTDKELRLSSQAFTDPNYRPSVDRKRICGNPEAAKRGNGDGIVELSVLEVRLISSVNKFCQKTQKPTLTYAVNVIADPIFDTENENLAHALIISDPDIESKNVFRRLQDALCRLAEAKGWILPPDPSLEEISQ